MHQRVHVLLSVGRTKKHPRYVTHSPAFHLRSLQIVIDSSASTCFQQSTALSTVLKYHRWLNCNHVLILHIIYVLLCVTVFIYYFDGHLVWSVLLGIHPRPRHLLLNILGDTEIQIFKFNDDRVPLKDPACIALWETWGKSCLNRLSKMHEISRCTFIQS